MVYIYRVTLKELPLRIRHNLILTLGFFVTGAISCFDVAHFSVPELAVS